MIFFLNLIPIINKHYFKNNGTRLCTVDSFFLQLPRMENYSTVDYELRVNIARVFVLRIANLAALIFSLHRKIQEVRRLPSYNVHYLMFLYAPDLAVFIVCHFVLRAFDFFFLNLCRPLYNLFFG